MSRLTFTGSYEISGYLFFIEQCFLEILSPNFQPRSDDEPCLTPTDSQEHLCNSKRIPQLETTNYLASEKEEGSIY